MAGALSDHAATIARTFGVGSPLAEMALTARGEQGRVWRLDAAEGVLAIKELVVLQTCADAELDVAYQEAVLASGSVAMPRPVRTVDGGVLAAIDGHQLRAYEWVDLRPVDRKLDPALIGKTVAMIHQVLFEPARPVHTWYTEPVGAPRWAELLEAAKARAVPFAETLAAEIPHLVRLEGLMEEPVRLQNCHRDLWADNILPVAGGGVCVIDWENCGLEDPARELPMALIDFGRADPSRMTSLYRSYCEAGGPAKIDGYGAFTMVIAQFGHFWESAVVAYLAEDASSEVKAHSLERIEELLTPPLRVEDLDRMLDAVNSG